MSTNTNRQEGYITVAVKMPNYLGMAVDLALSVREHDPQRSISIVIDKKLRRRAAPELLAVFDEVVTLPADFAVQKAMKYSVAEATPYAHTMFIDADALLVASMASTWDLIDREGMTFAGEMLTAAENRNHHGFNTSELMQTYGAPSYLKTNSGVFAFEKEVGIRIFRLCRDLYLKRLRVELSGGWIGDELAIGIVGGQHGLSIFPQPGPMYWPNEMALLEPEEPFAKPVLHLIGEVNAPVWEVLLDTIDARRRAAGLPADSRPFWQAKHRPTQTSPLAQVTRKRFWQWW